MVELRLDELIKTEHRSHPDDNRGDAIIVRSPSLLETTAVFPPGGSGLAPYLADADQVLRRVRQYTLIRRLEAGMRPHLATVGDPVRAPFALLGLPPAAKADDLHPFLLHERISRRGLDVVVADLTETARRYLPDDWEKPFTSLIAGLSVAPGRRPPVVVIVDNAHAFGAAVRILRGYAQSLSPKRPFPMEVGAYLPQPRLIGPAVEAPLGLGPVVFEPDIKDASLAPLRSALLSLGVALRKQGAPTAADAASRALRLLRRTASLPVGLTEARCIADILHSGDDEADWAARSAFRPKMELAPLYSITDLVPALGPEARRLAAEIEAKLESWGEETPVSAKLSAVLDAANGRAAGIMIAVPSESIRDIFLSSDRALRWDCEVVAPNSLAGRLTAAHPDRLVVVGLSPEIVRVLLTSPAVPARVAIIGDAAGVGLITSEIRPISRIEQFRPLAVRADALRTALARGGGNESLDLAEAEFRIRATVPEGEVDFTQSGEDYKGDIVRIATARGGRFAYRPGSDVLVHSPGELRPFIRRDARHVRVGDLILAMSKDVREKLRQALSGSRKIQQELAAYHAYVGRVREQLPGRTDTDKARHVVDEMRRIDSTIAKDEIWNVLRWIKADIAACDSDGYRMPSAARDWRRFSIFAKAVGMSEMLAEAFWRAAIMPTRAYRAHEGHAFNQRVVQFVLDPEASALGAGVMATLPGLWQRVLEAVDEVVSVTVEQRGGSGGNG